MVIIYYCLTLSCPKIREVNNQNIDLVFRGSSSDPPIKTLVKNQTSELFFWMTSLKLSFLKIRFLLLATVFLVTL